MNLLNDILQIVLFKVKIHRARFNACQVEHIVNQGQQHIAVVVDCVNKLSHLFPAEAIQILQQV